MDKRLNCLIAVSLGSLLAAGVGGGWLLWKSWQDGRKLELQNRELKASLEASRIRLENFCDYPAEALCPADGLNPHAVSSVADAMTSLAIPASAPHTDEELPSAVRRPEGIEGGRDTSAPALTDVSTKVSSQPELIALPDSETSAPVVGNADTQSPEPAAEGADRTEGKNHAAQPKPALTDESAAKPEPVSANMMAGSDATKDVPETPETMPRPAENSMAAPAGQTPSAPALPSASKAEPAQLAKKGGKALPDEAVVTAHATPTPKAAPEASSTSTAPGMLKPFEDVTGTELPADSKDTAPAASSAEAALLNADIAASRTEEPAPADLTLAVPAIEGVTFISGKLSFLETSAPNSATNEAEEEDTEEGNSRANALEPAAQSTGAKFEPATSSENKAENSSVPANSEAPAPSASKTDAMPETAEAPAQETASAENATPEKKSSGKASDQAKKITAKTKTQNPPASTAQKQPGATPARASTEPEVTPEKAIVPADSKKSWSRYETNGRTVKFWLTGQGDSIEAAGALYSQPKRYVVTLKGHYTVRDHQIETSFVRGMEVTYTENGTELTFLLEGLAKGCRVTYKDARTILVDLH